MSAARVPTSWGVANWGILFTISGLCLRLGMMMYGVWQDQNLEVKYTDIDYVVYHDAAKFMFEGQSPYQRATYRYTPLVALLLVPNFIVGPVFGKLIFIAADVIQGLLLFSIARLRGVSERTAALAAAVHLLNPVAANVCSRGNADPVISCLVVLFLWLLVRRRALVAGLVLGVAVHMKLYPIIYTLPAVLALGPVPSLRALRGRSLSDTVALGNIWSGAKLLVTRERVLFAVGVALSFTALFSVFYAIYGYEFAYHSFLYHLSRVDPKHNFSPYFLLFYLTLGSPLAALASRLAFVPQAALLAVIGLRWYADLPLAMFLQTVVFVAFNKVCTVQYFVWYQSLLPLLLPFSTLSWRRGVLLAAAWLAAQALWLGSGYTLEFQGQPVFLQVWLASLVFLAVNTAVLVVLARTTIFTPLPALYHKAADAQPSVPSPAREHRGPRGRSIMRQTASAQQTQLTAQRRSRSRSRPAA